VFLLPNDWMWYVIGDHEKRAFIGNKIQAVVDTIVVSIRRRPRRGGFDL
jgi:uncharacterized protein